MKEELSIAGLGAPLEIAYAPGRSCLVYYGEGNTTFESIRADLESRSLAPLGPDGTVLQIFRSLVLHRGKWPNLEKALESRAVLVANGQDILTPEELYVAGEDGKLKSGPVKVSQIREYLPEMVDACGDAFLSRKYTLEGITRLGILAEEVRKLKTFPVGVYTLQLFPGMTEDEKLGKDRLKVVHAIDITGDRLYFNENFQDFNSCCVFGKRVK